MASRSRVPPKKEKTAASRPLRLPSVTETATSSGLTVLAAERGPLPSRRIIAGSPATVRAGVESLAEEYAADEMLLVNILYDHAARRRSYELVAEAFGLLQAEEAEPIGTA